MVGVNLKLNFKIAIYWLILPVLLVVTLILKVFNFKFKSQNFLKKLYLACFVLGATYILAGNKLMFFTHTGIRLCLHVGLRAPVWLGILVAEMLFC